MIAPRLCTVAWLAAGASPAMATEPQPVAAEAWEEREPSVSPDGRWLVYLADPDGDGRSDLMRMHLTGKARGAETLARGVESPAAWSADGRRLLVARVDAGRGAALAWFDVGRRRFGPSLPAPVAGGGRATMPAVSPDGRTIAYTWQRGDAFALYRARIDGSSPERVLADDGRDLWPRFSRDGAFVYFFSRRGTAGQEDDVYRQPLAGGVPQRLTDAAEHDFTPEPSPDGRYLAFASQRDGAPALYVMRLSDGRTRRLSAPGVRVAQPAWHPDGRSIFATSRIEGGKGDIVRYSFGPF